MKHGLSNSDFLNSTGTMGGAIYIDFLFILLSIHPLDILDVRTPTTTTVVVVGLRTPLAPSICTSLAIFYCLVYDKVSKSSLATYNGARDYEWINELSGLSNLESARETQEFILRRSLTFTALTVR